MILKSFEDPNAHRQKNIKHMYLSCIGTRSIDSHQIITGLDVKLQCLNRDSSPKMLQGQADQYSIVGHCVSVDASLLVKLNLGLTIGCGTCILLRLIRINSQTHLCLLDR